MLCARVLGVWALVAMPIFAGTQSVEEPQQLEGRGDWKGAEAAWRALAERSPSDYRLWTSLGVALAHEERYGDAIVAYRKALALHPQAPEIELDLGLAYFKAGKLREAVQPLRSAAAVLPGSIQAQVVLGMSLYGTAQYREAAAYLEKAVAHGENNAELSSVLAQCYLRSGQYEQAKSEFEQMLQRDPNSPAVHMLLGEAYDALERREEAIAEFRAAAASHVYVPMAHFGLGYLLWANRKYDEAAAQFRKELDQDPKNAPAMAYLGDIEIKQENRGQAGQLLRRSIALQPLRIAYFDLGVLASDQKEYAEAIEEFKHAAALDPKDPDAHYRLAHIYQQLDRRDDAQEQFAIVKSLHARTHEKLMDKISGSAEPDSKP